MGSKGNFPGIRARVSSVRFHSRLGAPLFVALFAWLASHGHTASADDEALKSRFVSEAPKAWQKIHEIQKNLVVDVSRVTKNRTPEREWTEQWRILVKNRGPMRLVQSTLDSGADGESKGKVDAVNDRQAFLLRRDGDNPWVVGFIGANNDEATNKAIDERGEAYARWPWCISTWPVPELCDSPEFRLVGVEPVSGNGHDLAKVSFEISPPDPETPHFIRHGWMVLDPERLWSIVRSEVHCESKSGEVADISIQNEYDDKGEPDAPLPKRATLALEHSDGSRGLTSTIEFLKYERREVPTSDFTLAAFGIDGDIESQPPRSLWVFLACGALAILVALFLYRESRHRSVAN